MKDYYWHVSASTCFMSRMFLGPYVGDYRVGHSLTHDDSLAYLAAYYGYFAHDSPVNALLNVVLNALCDALKEGSHETILQSL